MNNFLNKTFNLNKKTVLITGASGYLGHHIAEGFLKAGSKVILLGRSQKLDELLLEYKNIYGKEKVFGEKIDFYNKKEFEICIKDISATHIIDVLINNAYDMSKNTGFNTDKGKLENLAFEQWMTSAESGIYWVFLTTKIIGETMKKKGGSIINTSSMYGIVSPDPKLYEKTEFLNPATYSVQKAGIIAFTRYIASFWGEYGIRCNAVAPGAFPNQKTKTENSVNNNGSFIKKLKEKSVLNRVGNPEDLLGIFFLLASDASSFITGQTMSVDGGWMIR